MAGLEEDTIGGFNALLKKQKEQEGEAFLSTLLFDHRVQVLHDRLPLRRVEPLTQKDYFVGGSTALLDALGGAIRHIGAIHRYARPEDRPGHTLFVITTDGMENASRRYTAAQVRQMIRRQRERYGWEFLFLGANMDAVQTAAHLGIDPHRAANYCSDAQGTRMSYETLSDAVGCLRASRPLAADWKEALEEDLRRRGGLRNPAGRGRSDLSR